MGTLKRYTGIISLLTCVYLCTARLSDYFDVEDDHSLFTVGAVLKLMACNDTINVRLFDESVRKKNMSEENCKEKEELQKCVYKAYQDPIAEYIKLLIEDASELCRKDEMETSWWQILLLMVIICAIFSLITYCCYTIYKRKTLKLTRGEEVIQNCDNIVGIITICDEIVEECTDRGEDVCGWLK